MVQLLWEAGSFLKCNMQLAYNLAFALLGICSIEMKFCVQQHNLYALHLEAGEWFNRQWPGHTMKDSSSAIERTEWLAHSA